MSKPWRILHDKMSPERQARSRALAQQIILDDLNRMYSRSTWYHRLWLRARAWWRPIV